MKYSISLFLLLFSFFHIYAQSDIQISGTITDATDGEPLIGVTILVKGTIRSGTTTDIDGKYSLTASSYATLEISYVGYKIQTIPINNRKKIDIKMEQEEFTCSGPVIYTYSELDLKNYIGTNTSTINNDAFLGRPNTKESLLQGYTSGVYVDQYDNVTINGASSVAGGEVSYIVDGVVDAPFVPLEVKKATVVKNIGAEGVYSSKSSSGGLILIDTHIPNYSNEWHAGASSWFGYQNTSTLLGTQSRKRYKDELRSGLVQHYDINASKTVFDKITFYSAITYDNVENVIPSSNNDFFTARLNINTNFYNKGITQNLFYSKNSQREGYLLAEYTQTNDMTYKPSISKSNPQERIFSSTKLWANPFEGASVSSILSYDYWDNVGTNQLDIFFLIPDYDYREMASAKTHRLRWENKVSYSKWINSHRFSASAYYTLTKDVLKRETYAQINDKDYFGKDEAKETLNELLGQLIYDYENGTRTASFGFRRSQSSKFENDRDYYYFPTATLAWDIARERFWDRNSFFRKLRLKASWGRTGNTRQISSFDSNKNRYVNLKWITTDQRDLGLDIGVLNNSLSVNVNYFYKKTYNLLEYFEHFATSVESGGSELINKGWNIDARYRLYRGYYKQLTLSANYTHYSSETRYSRHAQNSVYSPLVLGVYSPLNSFYGFNALYTTRYFDYSALFQGASGLQFYANSENRMNYYGLKNINVTYKKSLNRNKYRFKVFANIENLLTKVDNKKDSYIAYPICRGFSVGAKFEF